MKPPPLLRVGVWKLLTLEGYGYQDMSLCYWCSAWGHGSTTLKHSSTHHPRCIASILIEQKGNGLYFVQIKQIKKISIVKPFHAVTSIKQLSVLKGLVLS
jgi:hypothetical protein